MRKKILLIGLAGLIIGYFFGEYWVTADGSASGMGLDAPEMKPLKYLFVWGWAQTIALLFLVGAVLFVSKD